MRQIPPTASLQFKSASIPYMARPTLVVAETEPVAALSVRKLVLETAKFNVLTAHSAAEAAEIFDKAPQIVSALVIVSDLKGAEP